MAANELQSEVEIIIAGDKYNLRFTNRAMVMAEGYLGKSITVWLTEISDEKNFVTAGTGEKTIRVPRGMPTTETTLRLVDFGLQHLGKGNYPDYEDLLEIVGTNETLNLSGSVMIALGLAIRGPVTQKGGTKGGKPKAVQADAQKG